MQLFPPRAPSWSPKRCFRTPQAKYTVNYRDFSRGPRGRSEVGRRQGGAAPITFGYHRRPPARTGCVAGARIWHPPTSCPGHDGSLPQWQFFCHRPTGPSGGLPLLFFVQGHPSRLLSRLAVILSAFTSNLHSFFQDIFSYVPWTSMDFFILTSSH